VDDLEESGLQQRGEKRHEVDFKVTRTINEEIQTKKPIMPDSVCGMALASTWRDRMLIGLLWSKSRVMRMSNYRLGSSRTRIIIISYNCSVEKK